VHAAAGALASYAFGERHLEKRFCRTCGIHITNDWRDLSEEQQAQMEPGKLHFYKNFKHFRPLNARVLNDFDLATARPERADGRTFGKAYVNP
jgi:hypothetical protein